MSAFVVSNRHIDFLISAAHRYGLPGFGYMTVDRVRVMLERENALSVAYRYRQPGTDVTVAERAVQLSTAEPDPVQVLKAVHCYEYQACEHPGWEESEARKFCQQLTEVAITKLPGYDAAPWGL
jgi:hypothetical protein